MSSILMTTLFYKALILQRETSWWSFQGLNRLILSIRKCDLFLSKVSSDLSMFSTLPLCILPPAREKVEVSNTASFIDTPCQPPWGFPQPGEKLNIIASYLTTLLGNQILKGKIVLQESVARNWENKIIIKKTQPINQPTNQQTKKTKNWQRQNFSRQRNTRCYFCTYRFSFVKNSF